MTAHEHEPTPPELAPLESRLNAMAESDRRAASTSLEDRVFLSTRARLTAPAEAPAPIAMPAPPAWRTPLRVAAAVAILIGAGLLALPFYRMGYTPRTPVSGNAPNTAVDIDAVQSDLDDFLASLDSASAGDDSISTLRSDIASTEKELDAFWSSDSLDLKTLTEDSL